MLSFLDSYAGCIKGTLRIVAGYGFMLHGAQKILGVLGRDPVELASLLGVAGLVELIAGPLIALGLFTRPAAFLASGQMAVAYFVAHVAVEGSFLFPVANRGEPAVLYCFLFLYIAATGPGDWSLDGLLRKSKNAS